MRKIFFTALIAIAAISVFVVAKHAQSSSTVGNSGVMEDDAYLAKVLEELQRVRSATYLATFEFYAPGDTIASSGRAHYVQEFDNPADTTIGASFVQLLHPDTTKMFISYDGKMSAFVDWKRNYMKIDSFQVTRTPFRAMQPPFFNYTKSIIKYALETEDKLTIASKDWGDSILFSFTINGDRQIEFFGKPFYLKNPYSFGGEVSKYEIWVDKSSNLPYRVRREMSQGISVISCSKIELNKNDIRDFTASNYFPANIPLSQGPAMVNSSLIGKTAPAWLLKNADNSTVSLDQLKSKVVMIQFTSVSCGPCRMSVPFLNQLASEYKKEDFDFVSIESFTRNSMVLQRYQEKSNMNYDFLMSTDEVTKGYQIGVVPAFFFLDQNRVVRKVITGYGEGSTDKEIRAAIDELVRMN